MIVSFLVAVDRNLLIGNETGIPWHLPADLKRFRKLSLGKPIIMGRTTFEHIGRPLDKRVNIVLTRRPDYRPESVLIAHSIEEALQLAGDVPEVVVIGGAEVYASALPLVTQLHITYVDGAFEGTAWFPATIPTPVGFEWRESHREEHPADEKNAFAHRYVVVERVAASEAVSIPLNVQSIATGEPGALASGVVRESLNIGR